MISEKFQDLEGLLLQTADGFSLATKYITDERLELLLDRVVLALKEADSKLVSVTLTESSLTKKGVQYLVNTCKDSLEFLDLSDNNLQDDAVEPIKKATLLKELALDGNNLTNACLESLYESLGQLEFLSPEFSPASTKMEKDATLDETHQDSSILPAYQRASKRVKTTAGEPQYSSARPTESTPRKIPPIH